MDNVKELKDNWARVEKEIGRPLTDEEKNISRISWINGTCAVYNEMLQEE